MHTGESPPNPRTIQAALQAWARREGDRVALRCEDRALTFAQLDERSDRVAGALVADGIEKGDRIAYLGKNSEHYYELLYGAAKIGAVLLAINSRLAAGEMSYILSNSGCRLLVVGAEFLPVATSALAETTGCDLVKVMDGADGANESYGRWRDAQREFIAPPVSIDEDDAVVQLYTSGTTGYPKGAVIPHRVFFEMFTFLDSHPARPFRWEPTESVLVPLPVFHVGGSLFPFWVTIQGATAIISPDFDVSTVLDAVEDHRIAAFVAVPAMLQMIVDDPRSDSVDFSCLRYVYYGSSPIPLPLLRKLIAVFGCSFTQIYGMTEHCLLALLGPDDHTLDHDDRMASVGNPLPNMDLAVLDQDGRPLPSGEVGEVAVRSTALMLGYWQPNRSVDLPIDPNGWFRTGDAGYLDDAGYLYLKDRIKDMLISGGENVYPAEVERMLVEHPAVREVAVIGVPDPRWGEVPKAYVVPSSPVTADELQAFARDTMAHYKAPKYYEMVDELPRNATGKVLRRVLREQNAHLASPTPTQGSR